MRRFSKLLVFLATVLLPALTAPAWSADEPPLFITYGAHAPISEGDPTHAQAIYLSVPAGTKQQVFIRLFDPDTGGRLDELISRYPSTSTRFAVYGGPGAYAAAFAQPGQFSREERSAGTLIAQRVYGSSLRYDNQWTTLTALDPAQGELVGDRIIFRLVVEAISGADGNVFDVKLSTSDKENVAPEGARIFSFQPTIRLPDRGPYVELRFWIPPDAASLTFGNFDAAGGTVQLIEQFGATYALEASGQGVWRTSQVTVDPDLRETEAAITLSGGDEKPNDVTYYISDGSKLVPIEMPARLFDKTPDRPKAVALATEQSCTAISFDGLRSSDRNGDRLNYRWRFGDGTFATGGTVMHDYQVEGRFVAWLEVTNSAPQVGNGSQVAVTVFVKRPPVSLSEVKKLVAIREDVVFDGTMSTARDWVLTQHQWRFSDGVVLTGEKAMRAFETPGRYRVTHVVVDNSAHRCNTHTEEFEIRVNAPPVARPGPEQHVTASLVQFDGTRSSDADDEIIRYDWDFGDGTTGTGLRPTHVYAKPGTYEVRLTVKDASGTLRDTGTDTVRIIVNARPIADAGPDLVGAPGQKLAFDGRRSVDPDGRIAEYFWDFRDGTTATGPVVEHAFTKPGTYSVRLRVRDDTGHVEAVDYDVTQAFINTPPVAVAGPDVLAAPGDEVKLSGARSFDPDGKIASYRWNFSDVPEAVDNVEAARRYEKSGIYTAQLTVIDDSGAANATGVAELRIRINHAPVAKAGENVETGELTVTFDGTKSVDADGDPLVYEWDFGDGQKATGARVTHTFKVGGTYPVVLTVDDGTKLSNARASEAISVKIKRPPVAIAGENQRVCTGDTVVFDGSKSFDPEGGLLKYLWDFGDGTKSEIVNPTKAYRRGAVYPVTLTVKDDSGFPRNFHTARIAIRVDQGPVADAGPREILACAKTEVVFDGTKSTDIDGVVNSFLWDFGDGVFGAGEKTAHIYDKPGNYRAFLTIQGEKVGTCSATSTDEVRVRIIEGPVAVIKAPPAAPITDEIAFDATSSYMADGKITGWRWDFGDGKRATGAQVKHKYAAAGVYRVSLTITSDSTSPTCQQVSVRHVIAVNAPPVAAAGGDKHVAAEEDVVFDGSGSRDPDGGIVAYEWDLGDGNKASGVVVRHKYREPGVYKVKLLVRDEADLPNSTATDEVTVRVNAPPVPVITGPETVCVDERTTWRSAASRDPDGPIRAFRWIMGDGTTAATPEITHAYKKPGKFALSLYADDGTRLANSQRQVTRTVHVNQPPLAVAGLPSLVCSGDAIEFDGTKSADPDGKITKYAWDFGDGTTAEGPKASHAFAKPGSYKVKLTVTDDTPSICSSHTDTVEVTVNAPPVAVAGPDREVWIGGANDAVLLDATGSRHPDGRALSFAWQIGDSDAKLGERVRHTLASPGEYPVTLTVSDPTGLSCGTATASFRIIARQRN